MKMSRLLQVTSQVLREWTDAFTRLFVSGNLEPAIRFDHGIDPP